MAVFNRRDFCLALGLMSSLTLSLFGCTKKKTSDLAGAGKGTKIFYHYRRAEEKTIDPQREFDESSAQMVRNIFDTLLEYDYLKRPYVLRPALLEKMPEKAADGTYTFSLRKGVTFQDNACFAGGKGREMTADDVVYSFKRFSDANVNRSRCG